MTPVIQFTVKQLGIPPPAHMPGGVVEGLLPSLLYSTTRNPIQREQTFIISRLFITTHANVLGFIIKNMELQLLSYYLVCFFNISTFIIFFLVLS